MKIQMEMVYLAVKSQWNQWLEQYDNDRDAVLGKYDHDADDQTAYGASMMQAVAALAHVPRDERREVCSPQPTQHACLPAPLAHRTLERVRTHCLVSRYRGTERAARDRTVRTAPSSARATARLRVPAHAAQ